MVAITAALVKELRERTGAAMMDCKKALTEVNGNIEDAIQKLRTKQSAASIKKAGRIAAEGVIALASSAGNIAMIELNSETDFVARADGFKAFAKLVAQQAAEGQYQEVAALLEHKLANGQTLEQARTELVGTLGENINIRRVISIKPSSCTGYYLHGSDVAKIGAVVCLESTETDGKATAADNNLDFARDLAMHITALKPEFIDADAIPKARVDQELAIYTERFTAKLDPSRVAKAVESQLKSFFKEVTLLGQSFVKDGSKTIEQLLKEKKLKVVSYTRFEVGEGIEKPVTDFVAEVMSQV